jgi:branched-chain amino acid transport system permease protein
LTLPRIAIAVGLVLPFVFSRAFGEYGNTLVVNAAIAMLVVAGLHVLVHWAGQISIAQVAFMGVGAFVTTRANTALNLPLLLSILCGVGAAVVASLAIGLPALRIRGLALAITTLAFSFAATQWLFLQPWLVPQVSGVALDDSSLLGFDITQSKELVIPVGIATVAVLALTSFIGSSALGRSLRMVSHDEEVALSYGISVPVQKLIAFLYAGGCAGLAGAFTVLSIGRVGPPSFPFGRSIVFLSSVLLGGPGVIWGSMQAAAGLAVIPFVAVGLGQYVDLLGALGIIAVVVVSPAGLNGLSHQLNHLIASRLHPRAKEEAA